MARDEITSWRVGVVPVFAFQSARSPMDGVELRALVIVSDGFGVDIP